MLFCESLGKSSRPAHCEAISAPTAEYPSVYQWAVPEKTSRVVEEMPFEILHWSNVCIQNSGKLEGHWK